jgi:recombinational DNA repair ATPase RecF
VYQSIKLEKFTAFEDLEMIFSPGINIFVGANGTGKTHILKLIYAASDITRSQKSLTEKINKVFLPSKEQIGRLVKRSSVSSKGRFLKVIQSRPGSPSQTIQKQLMALNLRALIGDGWKRNFRRSIFRSRI